MEFPSHTFRLDLERPLLRFYFTEVRFNLVKIRCIKDSLRRRVVPEGLWRVHWPLEGLPEPEVRPPHLELDEEVKRRYVQHDIHAHFRSRPPKMTTHSERFCLHPFQLFLQRFGRYLVTPH